MIDSHLIRKYIYFPDPYEREHDPFVIHALAPWGKGWKAVRDPQDIPKEKFGFYYRNRCQPYTEQLWQACEAWRERRLKLVKDFKYLMEKGVRDELR